MSERKPLPSHPPEPPGTGQSNGQSNGKPTGEPPILAPGVDPGAHARQIHRRHVAGFLAGLSMAMPLAAGFSWLSRDRRAACPEPAPSQPALASPSPAVQAAPAAAPMFRPRLVIVLPEDTTHHYDLGHALGEYLNHGGYEALAPLAAVDLACIAAGEIDLPETAIGQGPLALLLIAGDTRRLVRFELPTRKEPYYEDDFADREIDARIAIVSSAVRRAVMDQDQVIGVSPRLLAHPRVQDIATRARAGYGIDDWRTAGSGWILPPEIEAAEARGEPLARALTPDEAAHFAPALLAVAMSAQGAGRSSLLLTLAAVVRRRVVEGEVPGAEWATSGGCGVFFEKRETNAAVGCGMGYVPERSRRFLHFYTMKPSFW